MNKLHRRSFVAISSAFAGGLALPAAALTTNSAKVLVEEVVAEINSIINSGESESAMIADFGDLFSNFANVPIIARYTLGVDARSMNATELSRYESVFQGYMARKYGKRFREFIGGWVKVRGAKKVKSFIEVQTVARLAGSAPFEVSFLVSNKGGSEKFFNMYIEGVNLLLSERTEIQAMLDKRGGDVDRLIKDLGTAG